MGDIAIATACYQYFDAKGFNYKVMDLAKKYFKVPLCKYNIVYGGGGLFTKYYQGHYKKLFKYFKSKNLQKAVILPASFYECDDLLELFDERFTVFCRDEQSFKYCCEKNKKAKFFLANDMVLGLNLDFYHKGKIDKAQIEQNIKKISNETIYKLKNEVFPYYKNISEQIAEYCNGNTLGTFFRLDDESCHFKDVHLSSLVDLSIAMNSHCADKALCIIFVRFFLDVLNSFPTIVSDRLHIGICSYLLNKKVYLIDNAFKKCSNVFKNYGKSNDNLVLIEDIKQLPIELTNEKTDKKNIDISISFVEFLAQWLSIKNNFGLEKKYWRKNVR